MIFSKSLRSTLDLNSSLRWTRLKNGEKLLQTSWYFSSFLSITSSTFPEIMLLKFFSILYSSFNISFDSFSFCRDYAFICIIYFSRLYLLTKSFDTKFLKISISCFEDFKDKISSNLRTHTIMSSCSF